MDGSQSSKHSCSVLIHHLFPLVLGVVTLERLGGRRRNDLIFRSVQPQAVNGLFPPASLQLVRGVRFDPVGEVLQRAVLEGVAACEGFWKREGGPTLEDLVG